MPEIHSYDIITPMVYAYTTPEIARHNGWTKIGYTEKQTVKDRIAQQTHTVDVIANLEWAKEARYTDGSGEYFTDRDFHDYLVHFHNVVREKGTEWFKIVPHDAKQKFNDFADRDFKQSHEGAQYVLRREQAEAVKLTVEYFNSHKNDENREFLWNAKPRFGKTLSTYDFMRQIDAINVLIVTNRPSIANSWFDDFAKFIAWQTDYVFVSECDALSERAVLSREDYQKKVLQDEDSKLRQVVFESLQGLKGSKYFGGEHDKLRWILDTTWDLLVIDEAHEGVDTDRTDRAFEKIKRKFTLHLSGTPFKAIAKGKFSSLQIYNWTFSDEQEAKENWQSESFNPYASMPHMNMLTYQMSKIVADEVKQGLDLEDGGNAEYAFDLNEFFRTENGIFLHKKDVEKFLDALIKQERFPFSTEELRGELKHTFWLMDRVDSAKAMAKLLKEHEVFKDYEIIVAAGDGKLEAEDNFESKKSYDRVVEAIKEHERTITLSVGQLTTGVTVPEWSGVFMLSNMKSPAEYIQAAFRAQNPYRFEKDGKCFQKENCYVFDFSPERSLIVYEKFANSLCASTANGAGTREEREENIRRLLNFFSVYAEDENGEMVAIDANKVLTIPVAIKSDEVINRGFMSNFLFDKLSNVFHAPACVSAILSKIKPVEQEGLKNVTGKTMGDIGEVNLNENGEVIVEEITVNKQKDVVFGSKIYEEMPKREWNKIVKTFNSESNAEKSGELSKNEPTPEENFALAVAAHVKEAIVSNVNKEEIKSNYHVKDKDIDRIGEEVSKKAETELMRVAEDFKHEKVILTAKFEDALKEAQTKEEAQKAQNKLEKELQAATEKFSEEMKVKLTELTQEKAQEFTERLEKKEQETKKRDMENDIRAHLRGFCRTIPSFIMAYGNDELTLANFEKYPPAEVFEEVTSITVDDFIFLRDGGERKNPETGETEHYDGHIFDEQVFNESVQKFLKKKRALSNYFDETNEKDIFNYIPPQENNQIFTPKKVVKMMVDELEAENPGIFDDSEKTFMDLYMKSGMYITEIVKRLFKSETLKKKFPNEKERLKHIMENQVYGLSPSKIIHAIALSYIFGFDETGYISRDNFQCADATPYAKRGELQKLLDKMFCKKKR